MSDTTFEALVDKTKSCCEQLYKRCENGAWDDCVPLMAERESLLKQLFELAAELNPSEIEILATLYQDILEKDRVYLSAAETEHGNVKKQLRNIKVAERTALPAYRQHS